MMGWYGDGNGWWGGGGMVFESIFWILIIGLVVWLITWLTRRDNPTQKQESPKQILDRRLAAGEIDTAAYAQARRLIDNRSSDPREAN